MHFLHVCGGVSHLQFALAHSYRFSPRMWRCFCFRTVTGNSKNIFSTYVEVFLEWFGLFMEWEYFLHVCGGVSHLHLPEMPELSFSPRMWRCFSLR